MPEQPHPNDSPHSIGDTTDALETERRRLAQQLEKTVIASLTLMLAQMNVYEQTLTSAEAQMVASVLGALTRQTLQQARDVATHLAPAALQTLGLSGALEGLASQIQRSSNAHLALDIQRLPVRLPPDLELALFRVTQDIIDDALRTAQATFIAIQLRLEETAWCYRIADNGAVQIGERLHYTWQRLEALGITVVVGSSRFGGSEVMMTLPRYTTVDLTERELDVLRGVVQGLSNKALALHLGIGARTVKFHLDNLYSKLQVNTRTEAAVYALRHGLIKRER